MERYLAQVSTKSKAPSLESFFNGLLVFAHPEEPPQLASEESFVKLLHDLTAIRGISVLPPSGPAGGGGGPDTGGGGGPAPSDTREFVYPPEAPRSGKGYRSMPREKRKPPTDAGRFSQVVTRAEYTDALSKVIEDVRHASIRRNLSEAECKSLAQMAVQQEIALSRIQKMVPLQSPHIVFNTLRRPVYDLAADPNKPQDFEHVELDLLPPRVRY